ncbi:MAG: hypothetical protein Q8Q31_00300 [Nanoarchaeota archaeon]|nr:hypothetical protein [Nanoarchaeota archaeon]
MISLAEFKKFFLFNLIGSLIICALVAVVTVLIGVFNDVTVKVLFTLLMVVIHSLVCLAFIWDNERQDTFNRLAFFINVLFFLIVLSFLTSIFGIWDIISSQLVGDLYQTYFVIGFAALHGDILSKALRKEDYLDMIVYLNYLFMAIVVLMLLPIIYLNNATQILGEFYFRVLAAAGIIDGTLSILTIIFYKIYAHKHPKAENLLQGGWTPGQPVQKSEKKKGLSIWVWILIIYLAAQIALPIIFLIFSKAFY